MPLLRAQRTATIKTPRPLNRPPPPQPRLQRIHIRDRDLLAGTDRARSMREMCERLRIKVVHRVGPAVVVQSCRLGNHDRVLLAAEILAKRVGIDPLDIRLLARIVCRHVKEERPAGDRQLVDGEPHQRREVRAVLCHGPVDCFVLKDCDGGVRFDKLAALDGARSDHAHSFAWNGRDGERGIARVIFGE